MLYGNQEVQDIILEKVHEFEYQKNKKVIFGAMVGSMSKGVERYDSDYDTRFLYLDKDAEKGYTRWDGKNDLKENDIHLCFVPSDASGFYDKIAYWEATSFFGFLENPILNGKCSTGLYHIVGWTMNSPYVWDPYGVANRIQPFLNAMFREDYEIGYYRNYISRCLNREKTLMREYLYSAYYAMAIQYIEKNHSFAPYYFDTIMAFCEDQVLKDHILKKKREYYETAQKLYENKEIAYHRKMANAVECERDEVIDELLAAVMESTKIYEKISFSPVEKSYVNDIVESILDSLERPVVRDVNENDGTYVLGEDYRIAATRGKKE